MVVHGRHAPSTTHREERTNDSFARVCRPTEVYLLFPYFGTARIRVFRHTIPRGKPIGGTESGPLRRAGRFVARNGDASFSKVENSQEFEKDIHRFTISGSREKITLGKGTVWIARGLHMPHYV